MSELLLIRPKAEDIAGQPILRPLPSAKCRSVGPFVFFDHMLEKAYPAGSGMNINCSRANCSTRTASARTSWCSPVTSAG
jgi:hypothetical protein